MLVKERGPEHSKTFTVEVRLQPLSPEGKAEFVGRADGTTKKNAEQDAAHQVLEYLATVPANPIAAPSATNELSEPNGSNGKACASGHPEFSTVFAGNGGDRGLRHHLHRAGLPDPSESMQNTLLIGDYLLVDKMRYGGDRLWDWLMPYRQVRREDIIVFRYPVHPTSTS